MDENNLYHNIIMENRKALTVSGVKDCISFDDETINLQTVCGKMTIKGIGLHIESFDTENGDLKASGKICAVVYTANDTSSGFFGKLFK